MGREMSESTEERRAAEAVVPLHPALSRVLAKIRIHGPHKCWIWTAYKKVPPRGGYGAVKVDGRAHRAHRWIYEQLIGPAPPLLDHLCRNRHCCNPGHLQPDTVQANTKNGLSGLKKGVRCRSR